MKVRDLPARKAIERFPLLRIGLAGDIASALVVAGLATWLRFAVDDSLPPGFPFLTFFPAILLNCFLFGARSGLITAILTGLASWYWFVPPFGSFTLSPAGGVAMLFFLFIAGAQVGLIALMQRSNRMLVTEREANARLAETRELLFRELQHRVSNNLQMVAAMLSLQRRQITDEGARAAVDEASRRLQTIGKVTRQLYDPSGGSQELAAYLQQLARDVIETNTDQAIAYEVVTRSHARLNPESAIPLALVVAESIANAIEHGFAKDQPDRRLVIRLDEENAERLAVEIEDNGRGLPDGFTLAQSDSLGLRIAAMLATQLGGKFSLDNGKSGGALARLELPMQAAA